MLGISVLDIDHLISWARAHETKAICRRSWWNYRVSFLTYFRVLLAYLHCDKHFTKTKVRKKNNSEIAHPTCVNVSVMHDPYKNGVSIGHVSYWFAVDHVFGKICV